MAANAGCYLYTGSNHYTPVPDGTYALPVDNSYFTVSGGSGLITAITNCPTPTGILYTVSSYDDTAPATFRYTPPGGPPTTISAGTAGSVVCSSTRPVKTSGNGSISSPQGSC